MGGKTSTTLLERLRDGTDQLAWQEFSDRYWRLIFVFAKKRGCSDHTAEDIVQNVMVEVFRERSTFRYDRARGSFRNWLGAVVRNLVARHYRAPSERPRGQGGDSEGDFVLSGLQHDDGRPEELWEHIYEQTMLAALLDIVRREVAPATYQAFELSAIRDLSGDKVAGITGLSRNAVYQAKKHVFDRLCELGALYRRTGQLSQRLREAMAMRPNGKVERSMTARLEQSMRSR